MANLNQNTPYIKDWLLPSKNISIQDYNIQYAKQDIEFLNNKLSAVTRDLTVYDFYNINAVIENKNEFDSIINQLIPGQSAIMGAESFTDANGESYSRGDIILKLSDYTLHHIIGVRGGTFYPAVLTKTVSGYTLQFSNTTLIPDEGETSVSASDNTWTVPAGSIKKHIIFNNVSTNTVTSPYSVQGAPTSGSIDFTGVNTSVKPIIKCYNNNMEEIYCTYTVDMSVSGTLSISNLPSCVTLVVVK